MGGGREVRGKGAKGGGGLCRNRAVKTVLYDSKNLTHNQSLTTDNETTKLKEF